MVDYRKYIVWQKSHQLVLDMYKVTATYPKSEQFNLISQINVRAFQFQQILLKDAGAKRRKN